VIPAAFGASGGQQFRLEPRLPSTYAAGGTRHCLTPPRHRLIWPSEPNEFDPANPFSVDPGQCSWAQPQFCSVIRSFFTIVGQQRNAVRAGGRGNFGRTDFLWHSGGEVVLRYEKRNVLLDRLRRGRHQVELSIESAWVTASASTT
jgi:hypothetical protein